jgi:hypothetical protein
MQLQPRASLCASVFVLWHGRAPCHANDPPAAISDRNHLSVWLRWCLAFLLARVPRSLTAPVSAAVCCADAHVKQPPCLVPRRARTLTCDFEPTAVQLGHPSRAERAGACACFIGYASMLCGIHLVWPDLRHLWQRRSHARTHAACGWACGGARICSTQGKQVVQMPSIAVQYRRAPHVMYVYHQRPLFCAPCCNA